MGRAVADRYRRLAALFADRVAAVPPDAWSNQSPCDEWTARELVGHVVDSQGLFLGMVGRSLGDIATVDDDPLAAWTAARDVIQADLDDPARAEEGFDGFSGPTTFEAGINRFICMDLVVHGWDLARATGLDERIDPDDVRDVLAAIPEFGDALNSPGVCGPALDPGPGADEQARMLALLGRA